MKSNFKRNLLIGFGASLAILVISSIASFVSITNLLKSSDLVTHTQEVINELDKLNAAVLDAETGQRGYLLAGDDNFLEPYHTSRDRAFRAFERIKTKTIDNPAQQKNLADLDDLINQRFEYLERNLNAFAIGEEITPESLRIGRELMERIRDVVNAMKESELELLATRTAAMNRFASLTPPLIISGAMIALFLTVLFYARVNSDYNERTKLQHALESKDAETSTRINIIRGIADQISQGKYEVRVDDRQSDALGSVAGALNKMATSLEYSFGLLSDKEWLQTGLSKLNDLMIGEKDIEELSRDVIAFVATYTSSNAGALYLLEDDALTFSGGFAYAPPPSRRRILLNEGLLGQSLADAKTIEAHDIPEDSVHISFATGEARPKHIIAIPILDGRTRKGAMELATLGTFSARDIEFLTTCAANIGIAINTAQNRRKLQELLEETQAQAEELKTQHGELENLNSELEVQAEKLQASEEELKVQQEELKQANQELEERSRLLEERNQMISERNVEIQNKADQLAQSTKYKSEFLANMSHELRTPLNSILLLSRLMAENTQKNLTPDQIEYARVIQTSGHGLLSLIDEILDLSKIESGKMKLEYQRVSLKELVQDMQSLFNPVASEKNIEFRTTLDESCPTTIETDKLRVEQIVRNLLSNAIKFTPKGHVELHIAPATDDASMLSIQVRDTGIGIPHDKQSLIFEAFQQADGSTRRKYGGTGLGLSISRELVKLLGGSISLRSEVDKGSEFSIRIPVSPRAVEKEQPRVSAPSVKTNEPEISLPPRNRNGSADMFVSSNIPESIPDDRKTIGVNDKSILIVEDDINFAKSLLDYTRKRGYKGIVSVRGDEAVDLAREFRPLGVLLDIQLPVKSGWEVMEELKNDPATRHIPVHIMSSHQVKTESLLKGAVDFINKPFAFDQMQDIFRKIEYVLTHHPKKVLIVEENAKHAKALAYFLETFELNLEISKDVGAAIDSLRDDKVDCVILDMGIPDQKAYDTLETVKKTPGLENLPIIIFTGKSLSQNEELRIKQYADSIVVKTAHSYKRIIDEVSIFLHLMEENSDERPKTTRFNKLGALQDVLKGKKVLVADDDMRNIFSLTKALEKYEMQVVAAVDGKDALQKLSENPDVDIVLMDMMMPEMDGYESTAAIRADPRYRNLPIIAVTAKAMVGDRAKCINAGASDYITKPVDVDQLFSLLRVWLYEKV